MDTATEDELLDYALNKSKFFPGDWSTVDQQLNDTKYDLMFTSETIYRKENYAKLFNLIKNHLKPDGQAYIAAKVYYFGLDGGCFEFIEYIEKDGTFTVDVVETINDNLQRKILLLKFNKQV